MNQLSAVAVLIAPSAVAFAFLVLGLLSRKLGTATRARSYYLGFFAAAMCMLVSGGARFLYALLPVESGTVADFARVLMIDGLPALAATLAVMMAWRYWSWLLAERA
ncbi:MAG: hypothetical protein L6Q98_01545 [Anaerolineae bacterium]|nr:hypothetical protein [Anaerolineae bacterium]NUQ04454.1 hypothetical protein [Anaerolineae bacterium]